MSARPLAERRTGAASIVCLATCLATYGKADDDLDPAQKSAAEVAFDATPVVSTILALPRQSDAFGPDHRLRFQIVPVVSLPS